MSSPLGPCLANISPEDSDLAQTIALSIFAVALAATYILQPSIPDILPANIDLGFHRFAFLTTLGWNIPAPQPLDVLLVLEELAPPQIPNATPSIPKPPSYTTTTSVNFEPPSVLNITLIIACYGFLTTIGLYYALRSRTKAHSCRTHKSILPVPVLVLPSDEQPTSVLVADTPQETSNRNVEDEDYASQLGDFLPDPHASNDSDFDDNDSDKARVPSAANPLLEGDPGEERCPLPQLRVMSPEPLGTPCEGSETLQPDNDSPEISVPEVVPDPESDDLGINSPSSDWHRIGSTAGQDALVTLAPLESDIEDANPNKVSASPDVMAVNLNAGIHSPAISHLATAETEIVLLEITDTEVKSLAQLEAREHLEPFAADDHPASSPLDDSAPCLSQDTLLEPSPSITSHPASDIASEGSDVSVHDSEGIFPATDSNMDIAFPADENLDEEEVFVYPGVSSEQPELPSGSSVSPTNHSEEPAAAPTTLGRAFSEPPSPSFAPNDIPASSGDLLESIHAPPRNLFDDDFWLPRSGGLNESIHAPSRDHDELESTARSAPDKTVESTLTVDDDEGVAASMHSPRRNVSSGLRRSQGLRSSIHAPADGGGLEPKLNTPVWETSDNPPRPEALNESKFTPTRDDGMETQSTYSDIERPQLSTDLPRFHTGTSETVTEAADGVEIWSQAFKLRGWARDPECNQSRPPSRSPSPEPAALRRRSSSLGVRVGRRSPSPTSEAEAQIPVTTVEQKKKRSRRSKRGGVRERKKVEAREERNRRELEEAMTMDSSPGAGPSSSTRTPISDVGPNWGSMVFQDRQNSSSSS